MMMDPPGEETSNSVYLTSPSVAGGCYCDDRSSTERSHHRHHHYTSGGTTTNRYSISDDYNMNIVQQQQQQQHHYNNNISSSDNDSYFNNRYNFPNVTSTPSFTTMLAAAKDPPTSNEEEEEFNQEQQLVKWTPSGGGGDDGDDGGAAVDHFDDNFRLSQYSGNTDGEYSSEYCDEDDDGEFNDDCEAEQYREIRPRDPCGVNDDDECVVGGELVTRSNTRGSRDPDEVVTNSNRESSMTTELTNRELVLMNHQNAINEQLALVPLAPNGLDIMDTQPPKYNGYQHYFITVREEHRFLMLYTFLKRNIRNKVIVFFSTNKSTQYYANLLKRLKFDVLAIHDGQSEERFLDNFFEFSKKRECGVLCMPDSRGDEFAIPPTVNWIVQFEPSNNPSDYIFRVGRISNEVLSDPAVVSSSSSSSGSSGGDGDRGRGEDTKRFYSGGRALMFMTPQQHNILQYYKAAQCKIYEYEIPKLSPVQKNYQGLIKRDPKLRRMAREAYHSYLIMYASHEYRDVYNVHDVDKDLVALNFGFAEAPKYNKSESNHHYQRGNSETSNYDSDRRRGGGGDEKYNYDYDHQHDESADKRQRIMDKMWKPDKKPKEKSWLSTEKTWRHADRHAHLMKLPSRSNHDDPEEDYFKPSTIKCRAA
jgi:ATP-dependent RNA helicase DDX18/HAS1